MQAKNRLRGAFFMGKPLPQLDLFEPGLYHRPADFGFFSILVREPVGYGSTDSEQLQLIQSPNPVKPVRRTRQYSYPIHQLPTIVENLNPHLDTWISQAEFSRPSRRVVHLARLPVCFVDLDTYKVPHLVGHRPEDLSRLLRLVCDDNGIPQPSVILFSGRGLQVKWLLTNPVPRAALPRWNRVQSELVSLLIDLGADPQARDASRVLRLDQTVNSTSGERVRILDVLEVRPGEPIRYDFETLAFEVLPTPRAEIEASRKRSQEAKRLQLLNGGRRVSARGINGRVLSWTRLEDLRKLAALRGWTRNGVPEGLRSLYVHWSLNFLLLSGAANSSTMYHEASALVKEVAKGFDDNIKSVFSTLYNKAKQYESGESIYFNGRKYPPLYTPTASHLIDLFQISSTEQQDMRSLASKSVKRAHHAEAERLRKRKAGEVSVSRDDYLAQSVSKAEMACRLRAEGRNNIQIAAQLGLHPKSVSRLLKGNMSVRTTNGEALA
jgi:DNA-binding CsgD family transcriptional regulator